MVAALQTLQDSAMERAIHGEERPLYSGGRIVGTQRVHNNRLAIFLMQMNGGLRQGGVTYARSPQRRCKVPADDLGQLLDHFGAEEDAAPGVPRSELHELVQDAGGA